jgi:anaerobic selenocysteine-containing dehydrogenase
MTEGKTEHRTFCRICPALCGLVVHIEGERVVEVRGDRDHPISRGYTCPKGRAAGEFHHHPLRLNHPRLRGDVVTWDLLLDDLATSLTRIIDESGPDAVALYWGTWSWMDALGRRRADAFVRRMRTRSKYSAVTVDAIARLTVADLLSGFPALLPAVDTDNAGLTVLIGSNPVISHGHAGAMIDPIAVLRRIARDHGLWVVDPRVTQSARLATAHLAIRPGGDPALLAYLVRSLLRDGADTDYIARHTIGVEDLRAAVEPWTLERAAESTGLTAGELEGLLAAIRGARRVTIVTGTGTTMAAQAAMTEWLAWAAQIVTGSFEAEGGAWFNPGGISRADLASHVPSSGLPDPGPPSRPDLPSRFGEYPCAALADEIEAGNVRALLVIGGDPLTALPDSNRLARAFAGLEVLAVADVIEAATVSLATHVLSVAGQFEREDLTWYTDRFANVTSAQRTDAVLAPSADRWPMADVFDALAVRMGQPAEPSQWTSIEERCPGLASPGVTLVSPPRPRGWVHEKVLSDGRWRVAPSPLVELFVDYTSQPARSSPLVAIPRRALRRMNSTMRDVARGAQDREVWINPVDAHGIADGDTIVVTSDIGAITAPARVTDEIVAGAISVPHGFSDQNVNVLTSGAPGYVDPFTAMVTQSGIPVTIAPA